MHLKNKKKNIKPFLRFKGERRIFILTSTFLLSRCSNLWQLLTAATHHFLVHEDNCFLFIKIAEIGTNKDK